MKRIVSCACIMTLAVFLTVFLSVLTCTKAEAASSVEEARQKMLQEDRKKEEARKFGTSELPPQAKEAGFIALSANSMNYADAVAFCKQHGGRLPCINKSNSWDGKNPPFRGILIDGFGYGARPWSEVGLPDGYYWTGTAVTVRPGNSWFVYDNGGVFVGDVGGDGKVLNGVISGTDRVVCVP